MVKTRRPPVALAAIALALVTTMALAQVAVAAPKTKHTTSQDRKGSKGAGHTKLPPGKGAKAPGQGGTPPGQAKKGWSSSQPTRPSKSGGKGGKGSQTHQSSSGGSSPSFGGTSRSTEGATVRGPVRGAGGSVQGGSLSGGSPLGGPGWFNFREGREFASDMAAREFRSQGDALITATRDMAFPIVLALLVVAFLLLQGLMDRRDPKLAVAPLSENEILSFE